jgi:hypothetical protein
LSILRTARWLRFRIDIKTPTTVREDVFVWVPTQEHGNQLSFFKSFMLFMVKINGIAGNQSPNLLSTPAWEPFEKTILTMKSTKKKKLNFVFLVVNNLS